MRQIDSESRDAFPSGRHRACYAAPASARELRSCSWLRLANWLRSGTEPASGSRAAPTQPALSYMPLQRARHSAANSFVDRSVSHRCFTAEPIFRQGQLRPAWRFKSRFNASDGGCGCFQVPLLKKEVRDGHECPIKTAHLVSRHRAYVFTRATPWWAHVSAASTLTDFTAVCR